MKKAVFLDLDTLGPADLSLSVLDDLPLSWTYHAATSPDSLPEHIRDAEIIVSNKCVLNAESISSASHMQYICAAATGFNHIDIDTADKQGIPVSNVRNYATPSVVEHVYALILALSTKLMSYNAAVQNGDWSRTENFCLLDYPIEEIAGKSLGIIGYGTLGQAVAKVAPAFGMQVLISQHLHGEPESNRLELDELLARADVVSLHLPLTPQTTNLISERELSLMKPGALLINASRGGIVNEAALAGALRRGQLGGAGVDVLSKEPPVADNPLLAKDIPNLIITPHTAWASRQSRQRLVEQIATNIQSFLNGDADNRVGTV